MIFIYILSFVWIIRIIANVLTYIQLWYIKEYRFDRMLIHLNTNQGKRLLFASFKRPPVSPKTVFLFGACGALDALVFFFIPGFVLVKLFLLDLLTFPLTALLVAVVKIPTWAYHGIVIRRAVAKMQSHKKMLVIGITGSYGKTSTKEILYTLLRHKYKTLKTEASKNSPIAIAETVLSQLSPEHEVFIVEMGAYKKGEIAKMSEMVHPEIAILTAINAQHQDLFGSIETTMKAKYELVEGLTGQKIIIANHDNAHIQTMAQWAKRDGCVVYLYSVHNQTDYIYAKNIKLTAEGISFTIFVNHKKQDISVHLFGVHQVSNVLAAIAAALACSMSVEEITQASSEIEPFDKTMKPLAGVGGATFIDDTFNNNPDAAKAAIDYLQTQNGRKILVFEPMVELGSFTRSSHKEFGAYAARVCEEIILTNDNFYEYIMEGVRGVKSNVHVNVFDEHKASDYIRRILHPGDTVLFKGKASARILASLRE